MGLSQDKQPIWIPRISLRGCDWDVTAKLGDVNRSWPMLFTEGPWSKWSIYNDLDFQFARRSAPRVLHHGFHLHDKSDFIFVHSPKVKMAPSFLKELMPPTNGSLLGAKWYHFGKAPSSVFFDTMRDTEEERVAKGAPRYMRFAGNPGEFADIDKVLETNVGIESDLKLHGRRAGTALNIVNANVTTTSHVDLLDNFFAVTRGAKHFILSPPEDFPLYQPYPVHHAAGTLQHSQHQHPPEKARVVHAIAKAGEMLYIPFGWVHTVTAVEPTIHVSFFAKREKHEAMDRALYSLVTSLVTDIHQVNWKLMVPLLSHALPLIVASLIKQSPEFARHFNTTTAFFRWSAHAVYSAQVRRDLGIVNSTRMAQCEPSTERTVSRVAIQVAKLFLSQMETNVSTRMHYYYMAKLVDMLIPLASSELQDIKELDVASASKLAVGLGLLECLAAY